MLFITLLHNQSLHTEDYWFSQTKICDFITWLQKQQGIRKQLFKWHFSLFKKMHIIFLLEEGGLTSESWGLQVLVKSLN